MPKGQGYSTGGKHETSGDYGYNTGFTSVDITQGGAGMGTGSGQPNIKDDSVPGGYGSSGGRSTSSPKGR